MKINEFLYASETLERHREGVFLASFDTFSLMILDPQLQEELTKARLINILQSVPGIGYASSSCGKVI